MTDLHERLVAALHEVRARTPRECDGNCWTTSGYERITMHSQMCEVRYIARVDARVATCVEAFGRHLLEHVHEHVTWDGHFEAGLAAFLAAAAQEDGL